MLSILVMAVSPPAWAVQTTVGAIAPSRFTRIRLDAEGVDASRLQRQLALRMPDAPIDRTGTPLPPGGVYVGVRRPSPSTARIEVVTADGRGYSRTVEVAPDDPERALATELATLLSAVESGRETPDATRVAPPSGASTRSRTRRGDGNRASSSEARSRRRDELGWRAGFGIAPELALGVAPSDIGGPLTGAGASFEGRAQAPGTPKGGLVLVGGLRVLGNRGAGVSLTRLRIHALGGWLWPLPDAQVELVGGLSVEPWWVRDLDGDVRLPGRGRNQPRSPLIGPLARVAAGGLLPVGPAMVRIGGRLELATSFASRGQPVPGVVVRSDDDDEDNGVREAFRLGGFELVLGLDVAVTWPLLRRIAKRTAMRDRQSIAKQ